MEEEIEEETLLSFDQCGRSESEPFVGKGESHTKTLYRGKQPERLKSRRNRRNLAGWIQDGDEKEDDRKRIGSQSRGPQLFLFSEFQRSLN